MDREDLRKLLASFSIVGLLSAAGLAGCTQKGTTEQGGEPGAGGTEKVEKAAPGYPGQKAVENATGESA